MRLGKHWILQVYRVRTLPAAWGVEHDSDPDTFTIWAYPFLFGISLSWSRVGWIMRGDATRERAENILAAADPQRHSETFEDEWDRLDAMEQ